jgi:hypothetical protein
MQYIGPFIEIQQPRIDRSTLKYPEFFYKNINDNNFVNNDAIGFSSVKDVPKNFIGFIYNEYYNPQSTNAGWKFHISLDDDIAGNVGRGWDAIVGILIEYKIIQSKVVKDGYKIGAKDQNERGKQIVIYAYDDDEKQNWQKILQKITIALVDAKIKPGLRPPHNKEIQGSSYLSYCNDAGYNGKKICDKHPQQAYQNMLKGYNACNNFEPDNIKNINILEITSLTEMQNLEKNDILNPIKEFKQ